MHSHTEELTFHKSSYSGANNNCVEFSEFRKSSYSPDGNTCVEMSECRCGAAVRDSQNPELGCLSFNPSEWSAFVHGSAASSL